MNHNHWRPPHPGQFPHPQANEQVQYCRECGQYHPIPQPNLPRQAPHPNFQQMQPPEPMPNFQQPEQPTERLQQPGQAVEHPQSDLQPPHPQPQRFEQPAEHPHFNATQVPEAQQLSERERRINMIQAIHIASEQVPGEPVEAELKREHGMLIYKVEIVNQQGVKYEVEIDVNSGNVLSVQLD